MTPVGVFVTPARFTNELALEAAIAQSVWIELPMQLELKNSSIVLMGKARRLKV